MPALRREATAAADDAVPGGLAPRPRTDARPPGSDRGAEADARHPGRAARRLPVRPPRRRPGRVRGHPRDRGRGRRPAPPAWASPAGSPRSTANGAVRKRSTRRRQDAPNLPRRPVEHRTVGRTYAGRYRPSTFLTLTLDSYGRVDADGAALDPDSYDYRRAARDAIHFPKIVDRFWQNTRRCVGWEVQYFGTIEPQRRGAPHFHAAVRGTIPRAELRAIAAATYHQVWWPAHDVDPLLRGSAAAVGRQDEGLRRPRHPRTAADLGGGHRPGRADPTGAHGPVRAAGPRQGCARRHARKPGGTSAT